MDIVARKRFPFIIIFLLLTTLLDFGCSRSNAKVNQQMELAVKYLSENKYEEAILAYREVIDIDPKIVQAYKGIGVAYAVQGKMEQASEVLQEAIQKVEDSKTLKLALAGILDDWGKTEQAEKLYREIVDQDAKFFPAYKAFSALIMKHGKKSDAITLLEKAAANNPQQHAYQTLLAEMYLKNGERDKALVAVNMSLELEPEQTASYRLLEEIFHDRWEEMASLGEQYIQQNYDLSGQIIKFIALYKAAQYNVIVDQYETLEDSLRKSPKLCLAVSLAQAKLGKPYAGLTLLKDSNLTKVKDAALLAEIAGYYLEAGDKETARKLAFKGTSLDNAEAGNYIVLCQSYRGEDQSQTDIWRYKYVLSSVFSVNQTMEETVGLQAFSASRAIDLLVQSWDLEKIKKLLPLEGSFQDQSGENSNHIEYAFDGGTLRLFVSPFDQKVFAFMIDITKPQYQSAQSLSNTEKYSVHRFDRFMTVSRRETQNADVFDKLKSNGFTQSMLEQELGSPSYNYHVHGLGYNIYAYLPQGLLFKTTYSKEDLLILEPVYLNKPSPEFDDDKLIDFNRGLSYNDYQTMQNNLIAGFAQNCADSVIGIEKALQDGKRSPGGKLVAASMNKGGFWDSWIVTGRPDKAEMRFRADYFIKDFKWVNSEQLLFADQNGKFTLINTVNGRSEQVYETGGYIKGFDISSGKVVTVYDDRDYTSTFTIP